PGPAGATRLRAGWTLAFFKRQSVATDTIAPNSPPFWNRMIRIISASVFATSVLLLAACTSTPRRAEMQPLKIAAWNLEHLAQADGEGCRPRGEADYAAL